MKVNIGNYTNWFGPYQLATLLCFWTKKKNPALGESEYPDWVHDFGEWLAHGDVVRPKAGARCRFANRPTTLLYKFFLWVDSKKKRKVEVRIDRWDAWSADHTLALIISPLLGEIIKNKHGAPFVADEDVPVHLRSTSAPELTQEQKETGGIDEHHFARWDWVLAEMKFAFDSTIDTSWEEQFRTGEMDLVSVPIADSSGKIVAHEMVRGENDTYQVDYHGEDEYRARITNGYMLFGKYYSSLWT